MLFNFLVVVLVGAIAYYHYAQGMLSSMISMVIAMFAAAIAIGYHESFMGMASNRLPESALAIIVVVLFAITYILPRLVFDKIVPGNVRVPLVMDKIIAGVCGIIAALSAVGVLAVAFQSMPWSETPAFVPSRLEHAGTQTVTVTPSPGKREIDAEFNEVKKDPPASDDDVGLWIPADRFVIGLVSHQSDQGALAGDRPFRSIHPNFLMQLYMGRLGIETGGQRTVSNLGKNPELRLAEGDALFAPPGDFPQLDAEVDQIRKRNLDERISSNGNDILFVVRVNISWAAVDGDRLFRFSPGAIRILANGKDYHPIGTLEDAKLFISNRIDDFVFAKPPQNTAAGIDLVFRIPRDDFATPTTETTLTIKEGVVLEVKRLARLDLKDKVVQIAYPPYNESTARTILRKNATAEKMKKILPGWEPRKD
ncbi:MAG TPA: hypothetical protein PK402_04430 [Tepidisphaeraceae bacterium]|nr:hypothetical protein [Tepidisphaeraceae bacterium]